MPLVRGAGWKPRLPAGCGRRSEGRQRRREELLLLQRVAPRGTERCQSGMETLPPESGGAHKGSPPKPHLPPHEPRVSPTVPGLALQEAQPVSDANEQRIPTRWGRGRAPRMSAQHRTPFSQPQKERGGESTLPSRGRQPLPRGGPCGRARSRPRLARARAPRLRTAAQRHVGTV